MDDINPPRPAPLGVKPRPDTPVQHPAMEQRTIRNTHQQAQPRLKRKKDRFWPFFFVIVLALSMLMIGLYIGRSNMFPAIQLNEPRKHQPKPENQG